MRKLLLLLFVPFITNAGTLQDIKIQILSNDEYVKQCPSISWGCTYPIKKEVYIRDNLGDNFQYVYYHELCHILIRPFYPKTTDDNEMKEEVTCDLFSYYIITGHDNGKGLFQKMILKGL